VDKPFVCKKYLQNFRVVEGRHPYFELGNSQNVKEATHNFWPVHPHYSQHYAGKEGL